MRKSVFLSVIIWCLCITAARAETVLITGSNRGLGLEFARQYALRGWTVIATTRNPEEASTLQALAAQHPGIRVERLDVVDVQGVKTLAAKYADTAIDVLINNAGVLGALPDQTLGTFDHETFQTVMSVNVFGPLIVSEAFRAHVARSTHKTIVGITSGSGIISGRVGGGSYFYKSSKIGLNMAFRALADDLGADGIIVSLIAPGAVDTDMRREAVGVARAARDLRAPDSVGGMIRVIDGLTRAGSGRVYNYDGRVLPW
jgi:NAD(P)-dependent dehydrogenase (short-subunit alcohol dehydrogenase family)